MSEATSNLTWIYCGVLNMLWRDILKSWLCWLVDNIKQSDQYTHLQEKVFAAQSSHMPNEAGISANVL